MDCDREKRFYIRGETRGKSACAGERQTTVGAKTENTAETVVRRLKANNGERKSEFLQREPKIP